MDDVVFPAEVYAHLPQVKERRAQQAAHAHAQLVVEHAQRALETAGVKLAKAEQAVTFAHMAVEAAEVQLQQAHRDAEAAAAALEG